MIWRREDFGLGLKTRDAIRIAGHRGTQHFDRDLTLQMPVGRLSRLPHSAFADLGGDFVGGKTGTG